MGQRIIVITCLLVFTACGFGKKQTPVNVPVVKQAFNAQDFEKCNALLNGYKSEDILRMDSSLLFVKAYSLYKTGHYADAIDAFDFARQQKLIEDSSYYAIVAKSYGLCGQRERSLLYYDSTFLYPSNYPYLMDRASLYRKLGQYDNAVKDCHRLLSLCLPNTAAPDSSNVFGAYNNLANIYLETNNNDSALVYIQKSMAFWGKNDISYINLGVYYHKVNKPDSAFICLDRAVAIAPDHPFAYLIRGKLKYELNDKQSACTDLRRASDLGSVEAETLVKKYCH